VFYTWYASTTIARQNISCGGTCYSTKYQSTGVIAQFSCAFESLYLSTFIAGEAVMSICLLSCK